MRQRVREVLTLVNHPEIPLDEPIQNLSVGIKQIVEIARALADNARVLIMDEPTSSLSLEDSERLFQIIRNLKFQGVSIVYISHFLEEVQKVADRYNVLRDGKNVRSGAIKDTSLEEIIQHMIGQKLDDMFPKIPHEQGEAILSLESFRGKNMASAIDPKKICREFIYHHPVYEPDGLAARHRHSEISGVHRTHYAGAYWGYGFHEDGVVSALSVCRLFGKTL